MCLSIFARLALIVSIVATAGAAPQSAPALKLTSVGAIGTGCPPGSFSGRVNNDDSVTLYFSKFQANAGPSYDLSDGRVNCQVTLGVDIPAGYQFAFDQTLLNAAYSVESKVKATSDTYYYFQGQLQESSGGCAVAGPASSGSTTLVNKFSPLIWSSCGSATVVNLNTALRVDNGATNGSGYITVRNSTSASFVWRKC